MNAVGLRSLVALAFAAVLASCSRPVEPLHSDIDVARRTWLASNATSYSFEVAISSSWFPQGGTYRVRVEDREVVSASHVAGGTVANFSLTVDDIWDGLLAARAQGQLNSVLFDTAGVPVESDYGVWEVDGGVHYSVRAFVKSR